MMFLGIDLSCAFDSLRDGKIPDKDCLLPLMSKVLGYCIVAASTTVKLPQPMYQLGSSRETSLLARAAAAPGFIEGRSSGFASGQNNIIELLEQFYDIILQSEFSPACRKKHQPAVTDSSTFAFWSKSSIDIEPRRIGLLS